MSQLFCSHLLQAGLLAQKWGCFWNFEEMVLCYQNCFDLLWEKIDLVIEKNFWNSRLKAENLQKNLRSLEQFIQTVKGQTVWLRTIFETECFFNLFLEVSQILYIRTIRIESGKYYWDLETCRKSYKCILCETTSFQWFC